MTSNLVGLIYIICSVLLAIVLNVISELICKKIFKRPLNRINKAVILLISIALLLMYLTWNIQYAEKTSTLIGLDKERSDIRAILNNKGYNLYRLGKYEDAISCYDQAIKIDQTYEIATNNKKEALRTYRLARLRQFAILTEL